MSWVATASSSTVESSTRRVFPRITPVCLITVRTASKIRFGDLDAASRRRQYVNVVAWKEVSVTASPHAAFQGSR